jgi:hypothetical protein
MATVLFREYQPGPTGFSIIVMIALGLGPAIGLVATAVAMGATLQAGAGAGTADIRTAFHASRRSSFRIFNRTIPLT